MNKYISSHITFFKINGREYAIHNFVLEKMAVFAAIFIDKIDDSNVLELSFPVSEENIEKVFSMVYDFDEKKICTESIRDALEIVSFMKYLGIDIDTIEEIAKVMINSQYISKFIDGCADLESYDTDLLLLSKYTSDYYSESINDITKKIKNLNFPTEFFIHIIKKLVKRGISKNNLDIKLSDCHNKTFIMDHIPRYYANHGINIKQHLIHCDKIIYSSPQTYKFKIPVVTKFVVDDAEVKITDDNEPYFSDSIINLTDTVATHIATLLWEKIE